MLKFTDWLKEKKFYVREEWDWETGTWKGAGVLVLSPFQEQILDAALHMTDGIFDYETIVYSTVKKSGKTALVAAVGAWYVEEVAPSGSEAFCIANDLESAEGRVMKDIKYHFQKRIEHRDPLHNNKTNRDMFYTSRNTSITLYNITLPNDTFIQALSQSYKSVAGSRQAITLWDELWGYTTELSHRVWDEMIPVPTVPNSLRVIATYAGFENESDLLWDLYLQGVDSVEHEQGKASRLFPELPVYVNKRLFTYWDHDPRMPWQTTAYYEERMTMERPAAFLQKHMNQWVTSHEQFIPVEWYDAAAKNYRAPMTLWDEHPMRNFPITIGVDAGQLRDSTALVGVGYDAKRGKVGECFHKIWTPQGDEPVDLDATVERELLEMYNRFNVVKILYDKTHLIQTMLRLKRKGLPVIAYEQTTLNMVRASQLLFDLLKNRNLETFPDDEARTHIQMAVAETTSKGFRIVKSRTSKRHKIDYAIALAMACFGAVESGGVDISVPLRIESPFSDATAWNIPAGQEKLPFALQSEE